MSLEDERHGLLYWPHRDDPKDSVGAPINRVRAAVSGLPPGKWERRLFMCLQFFGDDSGSAPDQGLFVLGGFLAPADRWVAFVERWNRALAETPKVDFVKFRHAMTLDPDGQFKGWTAQARDEKLEVLAAIIKDHAVARFHAAMKHEHFERFLQSVPAPRRLLMTDRPYQFLLNRLVGNVSTFLSERGVTDQCDFYLDKQDGYDVEAYEIWPKLVEISKEAPPFPGATPVSIGPDLRFEKEEDFQPLQAADLYAGATRQVIMTRALPDCLQSLVELPGEGSILTEADVRDVGIRFLDAIIAMKEKDPALELLASRRQALAAPSPMGEG